MPELAGRMVRRSRSFRILAVFLVCAIGVTSVAALALGSGVYRRRLTALEGSGLVQPQTDVPDKSLDNTLGTSGSSVGTYCPIPRRGPLNGRDGNARNLGDTLFASGQSSLPDSTATGLCTGTGTQPILRLPSKP